MINEFDIRDFPRSDNVITVSDAKLALDKAYDDMYHGGLSAEWYMLEEFIKQYEDWVKVKTMTRGVLLKGKDE